MPETRAATATAANQLQLESIMAAIQDMNAQQSAQLEHLRKRLDVLEGQPGVSFDAAAAGASNLCTNPTCALLHGSRRDKCVEGERVHDFCSLTCATAAQATKGPAGPQPFSSGGALAAPPPLSREAQYPLGDDVREVLRRKPDRFTEHAALLRLRMHLQDIRHYAREYDLIKKHDEVDLDALLVDLEGHFNTHIDAFVLAPCVMQVDDKVAAAAFNQGLGFRV